MATTDPRIDACIAKAAWGSIRRIESVAEPPTRAHAVAQRGEVRRHLHARIEQALEWLREGKPRQWKCQ